MKGRFIPLSNEMNAQVYVAQIAHRGKCDACNRRLRDIAYIALHKIRLCMSCAYDIVWAYDIAVKEREGK